MPYKKYSQNCKKFRYFPERPNLPQNHKSEKFILVFIVLILKRRKKINGVNMISRVNFMTYEKNPRFVKQPSKYILATVFKINWLKRYCVEKTIVENRQMDRNESSKKVMVCNLSTKSHQFLSPPTQSTCLHNLWMDP